MRKQSKYIPPEKMTEQQLREELGKSYSRWEEIAREGCADPFWEDGVNMNFVRNRIIHLYRLLEDKWDGVQLSLFEGDMDSSNERPIPPKVPNDYMVPNGKYADRFTRRK